MGKIRQPKKSLNTTVSHPTHVWDG